MKEKVESISIWDQLDPEKGIKEKYIEHLIDLGIGNLPRMDESYVISPQKRAKLKREYAEKHLKISWDEAVALSGWDKERLEKEREKWKGDKKNLKLPVAISVLHDVIATCHLYIDWPDQDKQSRQHLLKSLNLELQARISKRIERETFVSDDINIYRFKKERGMAIFPGLDHLPSDALVNTLKRLEVGLESINKDRPTT